MVMELFVEDEKLVKVELRIVEASGYPNLEKIIKGEE